MRTSDQGLSIWRPLHQAHPGPPPAAASTPPEDRVARPSECCAPSAAGRSSASAAAAWHGAARVGPPGSLPAESAMAASRTARFCLFAPAAGYQGLAARPWPAAGWVRHAAPLAAAAARRRRPAWDPRRRLRGPCSRRRPSLKVSQWVRGHAGLQALQYQHCSCHRHPEHARACSPQRRRRGRQRQSRQRHLPMQRQLST